jgi:hypothetical protein
VFVVKRLIKILVGLAATEVLSWVVIAAVAVAASELVGILSAAPVHAAAPWGEDWKATSASIDARSKACRAIGWVDIGMKADFFRNRGCLPDGLTVSLVKGRRVEQWLYQWPAHDGALLDQYLYFEDGILTSVQGYPGFQVGQP